MVYNDYQWCNMFYIFAINGLFDAFGELIFVLDCLRRLGVKALVRTQQRESRGLDADSR